MLQQAAGLCPAVGGGERRRGAASGWEEVVAALEDSQGGEQGQHQNEQEQQEQQPDVEQRERQEEQLPGQEQEQLERRNGKQREESEEQLPGGEQGEHLEEQLADGEREQHPNELLADGERGQRSEEQEPGVEQGEEPLPVQEQDQPDQLLNGEQRELGEEQLAGVEQGQQVEGPLPDEEEGGNRAYQLPGGEHGGQQEQPPNAPDGQQERHGDEKHQEEEEEVVEDDDDKLDEKEKRSWQTLNLVHATFTISDSEDSDEEKKALLKWEQPVHRLTGMFCRERQDFVLSLLQRHAPHLRELEMHNAAPAVMRAAARLPQLRILEVNNFEFIRSSSASSQFALSPGALIGPGLRKLSLTEAPWPVIAHLVSAHRASLRELELETILPGSDDDNLVPLTTTLPHLRRLMIETEVDGGTAELRAQMRQNWLALLLAARHSLRTLELRAASREVLQCAQGLPRLRELKLDSTEDSLIRDVGLEPPNEHSPLRVVHFGHRVHERVILEVLVANALTLEEVTIVTPAPDHLIELQRMPRLTKLSLESSSTSLEQHPAIPVEDTTPRRLRCLKAPYDLPSLTMPSLLTAYKESLEELEVFSLGQAVVELLRDGALPNLRRLKLYEVTPQANEEAAVLLQNANVARLPLESLELNDRASRAALWLLTASSASLRELRLQELYADALREISRMPELRTLRYFYVDKRLVKTPDAFVRRLPHDGGLHVLRALDDCGQSSRAALQCLLVAHRHSLEEVDVDRVGREHLLTALRMPRLRRLRVRGAYSDLHELPSTLPEVVVDGGGLEWLRLTDGLPQQTVASLLLANRHSLKQLELEVSDYCEEDELVDAIWPSSWRGAHRLVAQSALEQLETLYLVRTMEECRFAVNQCPRQLDALRRVLPGIDVLCSWCSNRDPEPMTD